MKKFFNVVKFLSIFIFFIFMSQVFGQSGTLVVYSGGTETHTLDQVIGSDTTSNGLQKHSIYKLVSIDTTYLYDATITIKSGIQIIGVPDPSTGKLPCIQADILLDSSIPDVFFTSVGKGSRIVFKNLYLLGLAPNNSYNLTNGIAVQISADSISLTVDNVVFDNFSKYAIGYAGNWDNFYLTNCKVRNLTDPPNSYYVGEFLRNENNIGAFTTDSIVMKDNTMLCVSGYAAAATGGIVNYFDFSHNDVIYTFKNPFFLDRMVNAKFDNNIFYNVYAGGQTELEANGYDSFIPNTGPGIIVMGPLDAATASLLMGHTVATDDSAAEAMRKVEVKNNVYFWSPKLIDYWSNWNSTATVTDTILTPKFMNDTTLYMFNNKNRWPEFIASGNENIDPGFGPSIDKVLDPGSDTTYGEGLLNWFAAVRGGTGTSGRYGYKITQTQSAYDWTPEWPLPETEDLKYSNKNVENMSTDGKPLGDPYWFNGLTGIKEKSAPIPENFDLSNNYPNPFNPSTNMKISLKKSGVISLKIYNVLGELVKIVYQGYKHPGVYTYNVNLDNHASGVYFYTLQQGKNLITKKMLLLK